jgi:hypothetical protein
MQEKVIFAFKNFLKKAGEHSLKVLLTTGGLDAEMDLYPVYDEYLTEIADGLKNDTSLFSYDYYNEPHNAFNYVLTPINGAQNKKVNNNFPVINQLPYSRRYCMVRSCKGQVNARLIARSNPTGTLDRNLSIQ